jgi:hypothetical protein
MNPEETDNIDIDTEATATEEDTDQIVGDVPTILDLVMDGKASEAKDAIYSALYQKVGEKIDALRPEVRAAINISGIPNSSTDS